MANIQRFLGLCSLCVIARLEADNGISVAVVVVVVIL